MASSAKRAPSLSLAYDYNEPGDIIMQDVFVPSSGIAKYTYYCCLNWNIGKEGGGYCGIQAHPDGGRAFIFSIWDPQEVKNVPITPVCTAPDTSTEKFGGEGTGLKSMNFKLGWMADQWYTMVVRRWDVPGEKATRFGCWVHDQSSDHWTHLITMEYPVPNVFFSGTTVSFLEDWGSTSSDYRCVHYRGGFKRKLDLSWVPFSKADFEVNTHDIQQGSATEEYSASCPPTGGVCIAAGGNAKGSTGISCSFIDQEHCSASKPRKAPINLKTVVHRENKLMWDSLGAPQFMYRVLVGNQEVKCGLGESSKEFFFNQKSNVKQVCVEVSDILGNNASLKCEIA